MSIGRFNERYHIKGHLSAGAHGVIFAATDRTEFASLKPYTSNSDTVFESPPLSRHGRHSLQGGLLSSSSNDLTDDVHEEKNDVDTCIYAIKRIFVRNRIMPLNVLREIKTLQYLRGTPNIIELLDATPSGSSINLVFRLAPANLTTVIYGHRPSMNSTQVALYSRMLLEGVAAMHKASIVHRDLKPSNLLIDWNGILKITDFGQARAIQPDDDNLTHKVSTRWYRAPELLYGSNRYDQSVDLWSVGVIIGEMATEWPLFKADTDIEQLSLVIRSLGPPTDKEWIKTLPDYNKIQFVIPPDESDNAYERWLQNVIQCSEEVKKRPFPGLEEILSQLCKYTNRTSAWELLESEPFLDLSQFESNIEKFLIKLKKVKHLSQPVRRSISR